MVRGKLIYLLGIFTNIFTINIVKYIGLSGLISVYEVIAIRALCGTLILLPFNFKELKSLKNENKTILMFLFGFALISVLDTYTWFIGIQTVPINNAMVLLFVSPIITSVMSYFILKERITNDIKIKFLINMSAIFLIYHFTIDKLTIGYFFLMSDFIIYGISCILIKKLNKFSSNFLVFIRLLVILPISWIIIHKIPVFNIKVAMFVSIIVVGYILERTMITYALQKVPIVQIQPLRYMNVVFSAILSYLILGEKLTFWQGIGISIILFSGLLIDFIKTYLDNKNNNSK